MTRVSVVVINHDYERFVGEAIQSALDQDHDDVQVIVVDDASTDGSRAVIDRYADRVTVVPHRCNAGQGAAVNSGAAVADGDLVWFLDADDILLPGALSAAAEAHRSQPDLAKVHGPIEYIDADRALLGRRVPSDPTMLAAGDLRGHVLRHRNHGWPAMSGNAYARWTLDLLLPIPAEHYRQAADAYLNELAPLCGPLVRCEQPLVGYRLHGGNQFAGRPISAEWLRTKIRRTVVSHERAGQLAVHLGLTGHLDDVRDPVDVAFHGYRLASLRLDPQHHPRLGDGDDRRWALARAGLSATWRSPHLRTAERLTRTAWFASVAVAPTGAARRLVGWYLPDGPRQPVWAGWRSRRRRRHGRGPVPPSSSGAPRAVRG